MQPGPLPVDRRYKTSIPANARPRAGILCAGSTDQRFEYYLKGKLVGTRTWHENGQLDLEIPFLDGQRHGIVYTWFFGEWLDSAEPFHEGRPHGVAKQWSAAGKLIGTYNMVHGTGIDLWRHAIGGRDAGPYYLSEVHYKQAGNLHGFTWFINENQKSVWVEQHYLRSQDHGIQREWNVRGRLRRGFPKYFIAGQQVDKRRYLAATAHDPTLPPFREADNKPARIFPPEIQRHLLKKLPRQ